MAEILQGGPKDSLGQDTSGTKTTKFEITNLTEDYDMDCDASADAIICDVLGTLIRELIQKGVIDGTTA